MVDVSLEPSPLPFHGFMITRKVSVLEKAKELETIDAVKGDNKFTDLAISALAMLCISSISLIGDYNKSLEIHKPNPFKAELFHSSTKIIKANQNVPKCHILCNIMDHAKYKTTKGTWCYVYNISSEMNKCSVIHWNLDRSLPFMGERVTRGEPVIFGQIGFNLLNKNFYFQIKEPSYLIHNLCAEMKSVFTSGKYGEHQCTGFEYIWPSLFGSLEDHLFYRSITFPLFYVLKNARKYSIDHAEDNGMALLRIRSDQIVSCSEPVAEFKIYCRRCKVTRTALKLECCASQQGNSNPWLDASVYITWKYHPEDLPKNYVGPTEDSHKISMPLYALDLMYKYVKNKNVSNKDLDLSQEFLINSFKTGTNYWQSVGQSGYYLPLISAFWDSIVSDQSKYIEFSFSQKQLGIALYPRMQFREIGDRKVKQSVKRSISIAGIDDDNAINRPPIKKQRTE